MSQSIEIQIQKCEERLKEAMLQSDVSALDNLLSDDLIFTNHFGHTMTKKDDLEVHQAKLVDINEMTLSDRQIKIFEKIAIVTVKAHIIGRFKDEESDNNFRFTRVWHQTSTDTWKLTAGHSSIVI